MKHLAARTAFALALPLAHASCANTVTARATTAPPRTMATVAASQPPTPVPQPPMSTVEAGDGMRDASILVRAPHPIQFPRGYFVGSQVWVTYSTVAQDSVEPHLARIDPSQRRVLSQEVLTPLDHQLTAYASLAVSPDRIALAFDDDRFAQRMAHLAMFDRPGDEPITALHNTYLMGMFAGATSASIAWSPVLQQWAQLAGSDAHVWFARLRADGALIAGSGARLDTVSYQRSNGETFLWNGRCWAALVRTSTGLAVLEVDTQSHRLIPLARPISGTASEVSMDFDGTAYGLAWSDSEGIKFATVLDEQTASAVTVLAPRSRFAGNPALAFDGTNHYILWTELASHTVIRRARLSRDARVLSTDLFASHPSEHAWWPHVLASESGPRRLVVTFQVGQAEARVLVQQTQ